jgi:large subunit ribosomal protein L10
MSYRPAFVAPIPAASGGRFCGNAVCAGRRAILVPATGTAAAARIHMRSVANVEKKSLKVDNVQERLQTAQFVFQVPLAGLGMSQISKFKRTLPEGTTMKTVKNTLMLRAIKDTDWAVLGTLCKQSTIWLFVDEDIKGSVEAYKKFLKENKLEDKILGGGMDKSVYDGAGIEQIASLPSKQELYAKIAMLVQMVPTKLARSVKEVPTKLGRAIRLAFAEGSEDSSIADTTDGASSAVDVVTDSPTSDQAPPDSPIVDSA